MTSKAPPKGWHKLTPAQLAKLIEQQKAEEDAADEAAEEANKKAAKKKGKGKG